MKSVYFTSMKVQHQPPLEFSLFFFLVLRCLSLVLLIFAWQGAGCLTLKSGIWAGNPQTASPPSSFSSCRAGICSIFQDKERSPNLPAPPNPLLWMWFKSTQSVSVHCFHGQLENLRNEWKQTVTDQLNCILSSWQKRTPVGVPSSNRGGMNTTADLVGEGKRRRETRNDLFTEQDVGYAREVKADWQPVTLPVMLVPVASGFLALLHRCHFVPPQQNICHHLVFCTFIVPPISVGFCLAMALWAWCCCCSSFQLYSEQQQQEDRQTDRLASPNSCK